MSHYWVFWVLSAAVAAPLLAELPVGFRVPVVVLEVLLGILIGPHVLRLVPFDGFVATMFTFGMGATLFMAGIELEFSAIKGRPLSLAVAGWSISVLLGIAIVGLLHVIPQVHAPLMVTLALCTTGLGVLIPVFRDSGQLGTAFGRLITAAATLGEVGPIVAMSLLLSRGYSTWQELGFLLVFLAILGTAIATALGVRPRRDRCAFLGRQMHAEHAVAGTHLAADPGGPCSYCRRQFGLRRGILRRVRRRHDRAGSATGGEPAASTLRAKLDAVCFGWFYTFLLRRHRSSSSMSPH